MIETVGDRIWGTDARGQGGTIHTGKTTAISWAVGLAQNIDSQTSI